MIFLIFKMKRVSPPRSELVEAMRALNEALDRAEQLKNELETFETELSSFRFQKITIADSHPAVLQTGNMTPAKSGR